MLGDFTSKSCKNGKEMYKKVQRTSCKVVVLPVFFFSDVLVAVASSDLIVPNLILSKTFNMVY